MQVSSLMLMILGEVLLATTLISVVLVVLFFIRKRRDHSAAHKLISHIKDDSARRRMETEKIISEHFGLGGDSLHGTVSSINKQETVFYQNMINIYLKRDAAALENLNIAFEGAIDPYRTLEPSLGGGGDTVGVEGSGESDLEAEIERLTNENHNLSEELKITMDTMGRMLKEYSTMFAGGEGEALDKEKLIEMFREEGESESEAQSEDETVPEETENAATAEDAESMAPTPEPVSLDEADVVESDDQIDMTGLDELESSDNSDDSDASDSTKPQA
ncbi:MAG: hypothetical protein GY696_19115 [Gammaproteobacteria bacterium]|nr:hypothetical protein [Gammaproteobacteria bacterium]